MRWRETLRTAAEAVRQHRLRSLLTMLGIVIGIASVVLTVGLGKGAQDEVRAQIDALGSNLLIVSPGSSTDSSGTRGGFGTATTLTQADAAALADTDAVPDARAVAAVTTASASLTAGGTNWTSTLTGATPTWPQVRARKVASGRFFTQAEVDSGAAVAVLGPDTVSELFGGGNPIGQQVGIGGQQVTVIGVLATSGASVNGSSEDDVAVVPMSTAKQLTGSVDDSVSTIYVQARSGSVLGAAQQEMTALLRNVHGVTTADFSIATQDSLVSTANQTNRTMTVLLAGVAAISLVVGGIGVTNIMLVSVTERYREIGLRKALGATPAVIRRQFLTEALDHRPAGRTHRCDPGRDRGLAAADPDQPTGVPLARRGGGRPGHVPGARCRLRGPTREPGRPTGTHRRLAGPMSTAPRTSNPTTSGEAMNQAHTRIFGTTPRTGLLAVAATALALGLLSGCGDTDSSASGTGSSASQEGPNGQNGSSPMDDPGRFSGLVAEKDANVLQVQSASGQVAVTLTDATTITQQVTGTVAEVKVGTCVVVMKGTEATTVRLSQAVDGSCSDGFTASRDGGRPQGAPSGRPSDRPSGAPSGRPSGGPGGAMGEVTVGRVSAVHGTTIVVDAVQTIGRGAAAAGASPSAEPSTTATEVNLSGQVTVSRTESATAAAVRTGTCVTGSGKADSTGAVSATMVAVSAAVNGECTSGFGPGGGRRGASGSGSNS